MFVVVAEDHQDVLPWLHAAMRRGALPLTGWDMVHADAHPDLGALTDASVCERPRDLYAFLDASEFGISEWLLPLAFRGHLRRLTWLRSRFSTQFADGDYAFAVGEEPSTGRLCVDCDAPYFVEDESYSTEPLARARRLELAVVSDARAAVARPPAGAWVLDVCLDYFACLDPFAHDPDSNLARRCGPLPSAPPASPRRPRLYVRPQEGRRDDASGRGRCRTRPCFFCFSPSTQHPHRSRRSRPRSRRRPRRRRASSPSRVPRRTATAHRASRTASRRRSSRRSAASTAT